MKVRLVLEVMLLYILHLCRTPHCSSKKHNFFEAVEEIITEGFDSIKCVFEDNKAISNTGIQIAFMPIEYAVHAGHESFLYFAQYIEFCTSIFCLLNIFINPINIFYNISDNPFMTIVLSITIYIYPIFI